LIAASAATADWVAVGETPQATIYIDPETIRKDGDLRKVWGIQDMKERDEDGERSRRFREEYDCSGSRKRFLSATTHTDPMAAGKVVNTISEPSPWSEIKPGTFAEDALKLVCAN
jgi:hypothetical protein